MQHKPKGTNSSLVKAQEDSLCINQRSSPIHDCCHQPPPRRNFFKGDMFPCFKECFKECFEECFKECFKECFRECFEACFKECEIIIIIMSL